MQQQLNADGSWGDHDRISFLETAEATLALRYLELLPTAYFKGIAWLENHDAPNTDYAARRIISLAAHGDNVDAGIAKILAARMATGWGLSGRYQGDVLDTALVLQAFSSIDYSSTDIPAVLAAVKNAQRTAADCNEPGADCGWPLHTQLTSDPIATAQMVLALLPYQTVDPELSLNIAHALLDLANDVDANSPLLVRAHVAIALLRHDPDSVIAANLLASLVNEQAADGSWGQDAYRTAIVMRTLSATGGADMETHTALCFIPDANLRFAINFQLGKNAIDAITLGEMARLTHLEAMDAGIHDLTGLEAATNLNTADLRNNHIVSLAPLATLQLFSSAQLSGNPLSSDLDADQDGLSDAWEVTYGFNPLNALDATADNDGDGVTPLLGDCNDNPADPMARFINPGATEMCDAIDNNCDGQIDEGISTVYWRDSDNDGFGDPADAVSDCGDAPVGYVDSALGADCDDGNNAIKPGVAEVCEAYGTTHVDNNCDGLIEDPAAGYKEWYYDADGDGYGDPNNATYPAMIECDMLTIPAGYVDGTLGADCNDNPADQSAAGINPGAADSSIDGVDQNCDGTDGVKEVFSASFPAIKDGPHADGLWKNFISIQAQDPSVPVNVIIKLYNSDGSLKFQANDVTPVNGRLVKTPNWIMFANLAVEAFDGTVVVEAEAPILGMTNTIAPNEEGFNIYEAPTPRTSLFFPAAYDNFASGSGYQNILHLQNINPAPATVTVEYIHDFSGTVTDVATIPAYGEYEKNVRVVFGGGFNGTIRVTTDGASVGGMLRYEYLVANKIEAMTLYEGTVERSEIYVPYLYDGFGGNKNFIATMNTSAVPVTCSYDFYQNSGDTGSGPVFSTSQTINPGARFSTTPSYVACGAVGCTNFTGSMVATCNGNVVSTTNFITTGVEGFSIYEAADPKALMVFPQIYDNLNGYANEVHVQNPSGVTIAVGLELYFSDGTLLGATSTSIGPYGTYVMRPYTINTAPGGYQTNGSLVVRVAGGQQAAGVMSYTKPTFFDVYEAVAP